MPVLLRAEAGASGFVLGSVVLAVVVGIGKGALLLLSAAATTGKLRPLLIHRVVFRAQRTETDITVLCGSGVGARSGLFFVFLSWGGISLLGRGRGRGREGRVFFFFLLFFLPLFFVFPLLSLSLFYLNQLRQRPPAHEPSPPLSRQGREVHQLQRGRMERMMRSAAERACE